MKKSMLVVAALGWGESEVELDGGRKIRLGPGQILLAEDTTGQGHISRAIGSEDRISLFITLEEPSKPMLQEAAEAGIFHSELANRDYQRVQIVTVDDLLHGKKPELPLLLLPTYQQAEQVKASPGQMEAFGT